MIKNFKKWINEIVKFNKWKLKNPILYEIYSNLNFFKFEPCEDSDYVYVYEDVLDNFRMIINLNIKWHVTIEIYKNIGSPFETYTREKIMLFDEDIKYLHERLRFSRRCNREVLWQVRRCFGSL